MDQILYRVLSFDGGGIRGLYQASLIQSLKDRELDVANAADIIAGTSTGAIVAAALAIGVEADAITRLYTEVGQKVFPPRGRVKRALKAARAAVSWTPAYSSDILRSALESTLGEQTKLGDCSKRLIVPAISLNQYKAKVFDSKDAANRKVRLVDVVMASAAAPTYFLPARIDKTYYVDGGLCCNNPAFRAVSVLSSEGVELRKIYVLSISTGAVPVTRAGNTFLRLHTLKWIRPIIDLAMMGSSDLAGQDEHLVGHHCRVTEGFESPIALDDYRRAETLLPPLADRKADEIRKEVLHWINGPARTGDDLAGIWETSFSWEKDQSDTDTIEVTQCGNFVSGKTLPGSSKSPYTFSGTVRENVLIGEWQGHVLHGSFLLINKREANKVVGYWVGTGDTEPYFGRWSWERADNA